jgi:hypothetical protein
MATVYFTKDVENQIIEELREAGVADPEQLAEDVLSVLREAPPTQAQQTPQDPTALTGKTLDSMLNSIKRGVPQSGSYPSEARGRVKLVSTGEELLIEAGGYKHFYRTRYPYEGEVFEAVVDHKTLRAAIRRVKSYPLTFKVEADRYQLIIKAGTALEFTFDQRPLGRFIKPELGTAEVTYNLRSIYPDMVQALRYYGRDTETRVITTLAVGTSKDWTPAIIAADGFRLFTVDLPQGPDRQERVLIPGDFVKDFKVAASRVGSMGIRETESGTVIELTGTGSEGEGLEFYRQAIAGQYPNVARIVPAIEDCKATVRVLIADFKRAVDQLKPFAEAKMIKFYAKAGEAHVSLFARSVEGTAAETVIPGGFDPVGEHEIEDVVGCLNADYLKDAALTFEQLGADELAMHWQGPNHPLRIEAGDRTSGVTAIVVIMPMHMGDSTIEKIREKYQ